jgi:predicted DNA binding CopG/RHH family protein
MKQPIIPKFSSEDEEAGWWDSHRSEIEHEIRLRLKQKRPLTLNNLVQEAKPSQSITLRIPREDLETARRLAAQKGLGYQTYIKMLLRNALAEGASKGRCVHCLRLTESITADHVFPNSWYPDTTPPTVQRWTVPSCPKCNRELGQLEKDLLLRLIFCVNPKSQATSGLASKALRSIGLDTDGLSEKEKTHRDKLRTKIRSELIPSADLVGKPGAILGFEIHGDQVPQWAIPISWAGLSIIAEKIVRGCEYKVKGRFIEDPYGIRTFIDDSDFVPEPYASHIERFDFGPGCNVRRLFATEDPNVVIYWISVWNTLHLHARVDLEDELRQRDQKSSRVKGITPNEDSKVMRISPYLRDQP